MRENTKCRPTAKFVPVNRFRYATERKLFCQFQILGTNDLGLRGFNFKIDMAGMAKVSDSRWVLGISILVGLSSLLYCRCLIRVTVCSITSVAVNICVGCPPDDGTSSTVCARVSNSVSIQW